MPERLPLLIRPDADADVQARRPATRLGLARVGVTGVEKVVRLRTGDRDELFAAELECYVDLGADQKGAHMSRFEETVNEAIDEVVRAGTFRAETLAAHVAERVRERQGARRAETTVTARYPERKQAPISGLDTQELFTLLGSAVVTERGTRRLVGVQAQGMTACPCAQEMVMARSRERLADDGFSDADIDRVFELVPVATHNQRGLGTLYVGAPDPSHPVEAPALVQIVQASMSSEIYELLKRPDEAEVVERAHRRPRFVEDCVREMVRLGVDAFAGLGPGAFLEARQENLETIHRHNVVAEHSGLIAELAVELATGETVAPPMTRQAWLDGA